MRRLRQKSVNLLLHLCTICQSIKRFRLYIFQYDIGVQDIRFDKPTTSQIEEGEDKYMFIL